jgi:hypothetical protein
MSNLGKYFPSTNISQWVNPSGFSTKKIVGIDYPAINGKQILQAGLPSGNYRIQPVGQSEYTLYVDNNNQGGGWVLIGKGRQENVGAWASPNDYNTSELVSSTSTNTTVAKLNNNFINALIGGSWSNNMQFLMNRTEVGDSFRFSVPNNRVFAWYDFNNDVQDSQISFVGDLSRYTGHWWSGSNSYSVSNVNISDYGNDNGTGRTFSWRWSGHSPWRGWSAGSSVTTGFQVGSEAHAIQTVQIYVKTL